MAMSLEPETSPMETAPPLALALATPPLPALADPLDGAGSVRVIVSRFSGRDTSSVTMAQNPAVGRLIFCTSGAPSWPRPVPLQTVR